MIPHGQPDPILGVTAGTTGTRSVLHSTEDDNLQKYCGLTVDEFDSSKKKLKTQDSTYNKNTY